MADFPGMFKAGVLLSIGAAIGVSAMRSWGPQPAGPAPAQAASVVPPPSIPASKPSKPMASVPPVQTVHVLPELAPAAPAISLTPPAPRADRRSVITDDLLQRTQLRKSLEQVRSAVVRYTRDHAGRLPNFQSHQPWFPLIRKSRPDGTIASGAPCGPYLDEPPVNPLSGNSSLGLVRSAVTAGQQMPGGNLGFVFDITTGRVWAVESDGRTIAAE